MSGDSSSTWPANQIKPFLDYLFSECGLAVNTVLAYKRDLRRFNHYCKIQKLHNPKNLKPLDVQNFARSLSQRHLATSTIARHLVTVRMFMRFHLLNRLVDQDICSLMETPKTWQRLPRVLSKLQTATLIEAVDPDDPLFLRNRALLELLYATGMRASELADMELTGVNFQIGFIRCIGKGRKERIIPVHESALAMLKQYQQQLRPALLKEKKCDNLFVSRTGRSLSRIEIWRIVKRAALKAGMAGHVTAHTLRHCFGTHLLQGGAALRSVQEMLVFDDTTTTQIYTHVDQQHLRSIHKKYHPRS